MIQVLLKSATDRQGSCSSRSLQAFGWICTEIHFISSASAGKWWQQQWEQTRQQQCSRCGHDTTTAAGSVQYTCST